MENIPEQSPIIRSPEHVIPLECRLLPAIDGFNATTLLLENGSRVVIWRRQIDEAPESGQPDINTLVATQLVEGELRTDYNVREPAIIWSPLSPEDKVKARELGKPFLCNLEDPRAGENGFCGLTAVMETPETATSLAKHTPYAAVVQIPTSEEQAFGMLPEVTILTSLGSGKNATPIGNIYGNEHEETLLFRPEGEAYNHTLQVVTHNGETRETKVVDELEFPKTSWSQWRMGTAAGLFWLNETEAILPIHGINKIPSEYAEGGWMYDYTIGAALVKKVIDNDGKVHLNVDKISEQPLIVPSQLDHLIGERFDFRHIVYSCGVWRYEKQGKDPIFNFLVNKGDKGTVLVKISQDMIKTSLGLSSFQEHRLLNAA